MPIYREERRTIGISGNAFPVSGRGKGQVNTEILRDNSKLEERQDFAVKAKVQAKLVPLFVIYLLLRLTRNFKIFHRQSLILLAQIFKIL